MQKVEKWVSFDCFGTLVDWQTGFRQLLREIAGDRTDALVHAYHEAEIATEGEAPSRSYKEVLRLTIERAALAIGLELKPGDSSVLARQWGSLPFFADTGPALAALRADGWRLAVLTNCDDDLFAETRAVFPVPLDLVVTAQQVGSYKPAMGHFERFEQITGVARERWVHAGVSWWHDMRPAHALGIRRVWVDRENSGQDPALVTAHIHDMASLPPTLRGFGVT